MGSIPVDKPLRSELPVILENPRANEPPANSVFPRRPKNSIETRDLEYISMDVITIGPAIFTNDLNSSPIYMDSQKEREVLENGI